MTKNYKLEGDALEAAKEMYRGQQAALKAMNAVQAEATARIEFINETLISNNRRYWARIASVLEIDAEKTYNAGSGIIPAYLEFDFCVAFVNDETPNPNVRGMASPTTDTKH